MQSFEMLTATKSKLTDVKVLSQKNRAPDDNPGVKLTFETLLSNHELAQLDGYLKGFLFTKNGPESPKAKQDTLVGVEPVSDLPNLTTIGAKCGWIRWDQEFTGYSLKIILGTGSERSNIEVADCIVSGIRIQAQEGGSFKARYNVESPNVTEQQFGKLAKLKSRDVEKKMVAPDVQQDGLDDAPPDGHVGPRNSDGPWPFGDNGDKNRPASTDLQPA